MKTLIVEDDFTSRLLLQELLKSHGQAHVAVNGVEAVQAVQLALDAEDPYDLICLDIMLPLLDGQAALRQIRAMEQAAGGSRPSKVMMTTALNDMKNLRTAYESMCDAYLEKPIHKAKLMEELKGLGLA
jgi:two-component system chemotaxis response regulator CheY